jgi:PAS domain S-box-containing protein
MPDSPPESPESLRGADRLAALHATGLLDSLPEESFDRLLHLFRNAIDAPIALVTLVDQDRQFFKGESGLHEPWATMRQTPLTHSVCQHVVDAAGPFVVSDARIVPDLRDNLAITEIGVVAYAGVPIRAESGHVLGAVCAIDTKPREWSARDLELLRGVQGAVHRELELRAEVARRRVVEERLRVFEKALDTMQIGVTVADPEGRIVYVNPADAAMHGYAADELLGLPSGVLGAPEARRGVRPGTVQGRWHRESVNVRRDGSTFPVELWSDVVPGDDITPEVVVTCCHDLTRRDRDAAALRTSEERFRLLVEEVQDYAIILLDPEGRIASWNRGAERIKGYAAADVLGRSFEIFYPPQDRAAGLPARVLARAAAQGRAQTEGWRVRQDGTRFWGDVVITALRGRTGEVSGYAKITRDMSGIRTAMDSARRSQARLAGIVESAMDAIVSVDQSQRVVVFNAAAERMFGTPANEAIGSPLERFIPARYHAVHAGHVEQFGRKGTTTRTMHPGGPLLGLRADGTEFPLEAAISQVEADGEKIYTAIVRDVTERNVIEAALRERDAQLQQAQKMETVGRLAGGVAHDFNNLLMVIRGFATLMEQAPPGAPPERTYLAEIQRAAARATTLTQQLLAFGRKQARQTRVLDLVSVVEESRGMLRRLVREDVEIVVRSQPGVWPIRADLHQVEQILVNLVVNARDAIAGAGTVEITVANHTIGRLRRGTTASVPPGRYVALSVRDTGHGMDAATLEQVFEPFFTTKPLGEGTGLGLATVYGIVQQSGGHVWAESGVGQGSTFVVLVPAVAEDVTAADNAPQEAERPVRGVGTVLLAEDDDSVRALLRLVLLDAGYDVLEAGDGAEALRRAEAHAAVIDVVLTDTVMPNMSGPDLALHLQRVYPGVRVVLMSGYAGDAVAQELPAGWTFLQKPVDSAVLLQTLAHMVAER